MNTTQQQATEQTPPKPNTSPFADLFKPLTGNVQPDPVKTPETAPNSATPPQPGSAASSGGTVSKDQVFSELKTTEISTVTGSAGTPQPGSVPQPGQASVSLGGLVQAELAVNLMDAILPAAMVAGFYALGVKLRKSELQLTQTEKNTLVPIVQKCLDTMLMNFNNPWNALGAALVIIYGSKAGEKGLVAWIDKKQEKSQQEALDAKLKAADRAENPAKFDPANQSAIDIQNGVNMGAEGFTEEEIRAWQKKWKTSREKTIERLKKKAQAA